MEYDIDKSLVFYRNSFYMVSGVKYQLDGTTYPKGASGNPVSYNLYTFNTPPKTDFNSTFTASYFAPNFLTSYYACYYSLKVQDFKEFDKKEAKTHLSNLLLFYSALTASLSKNKSSYPDIKTKGCYALHHNGYILKVDEFLATNNRIKYTKAFSKNGVPYKSPSLLETHKNMITYIDDDLVSRYRNSYINFTIRATNALKWNQYLKDQIDSQLTTKNTTIS